MWSAHAGDNPNVIDRSAEQAHAADRFAREIEGILTVFVARSRRLMGRPFGGIHSHSIIDDSTPTESLLQMEQTCIITTALMEFL
jgi:hypothetical protein